MLIEDLGEANANPRLEYVLIPVKMNCCPSRIRRVQFHSTECTLINHSEGKPVYLLALAYKGCLTQILSDPGTPLQTFLMPLRNECS